MAMNPCNILGGISVASVVVDPVRGSDGCGSRYGMPVATLTRAKAIAISGDTILVLPGAYVENDLFKTGVNWHFMAGAIVTWVDVTPNYYGIFDDRSSGAVTCKITGQGTFNSTLSNASGLSLGTLVLQNASSNVYFQCADITVQGGFTPSQAALYIKSCALCVVDFNSITDPTFGALTSACSGIYWEKGDAYIHGKLIQTDNNGIWGAEPAGTPNTNCYLNCDKINTSNFAAIYFTGLSANYRMWVTCLEAKCASNSAVSSYSSGGKLYVTAQKLSTAAGPGNAVIVVNTGAGDTWINAQKISTNGSWIISTGSFSGNLKVLALEYEDTTGVSTGFDFQSGGTGKIILVGGYCKVLSGKAINHVGAVVRVQGMIIDTSNTNAAGNTPALLTASGLVLDRCTLIAPALSFSVKGAAAGKTCKNYGSVANLAIDAANVTVQVGAITVDANVA